MSGFAIACIVGATLCLERGLYALQLIFLKKLQHKQRKIMEANKGKCLETIKEESKSPKEAVSMATWIDGMQQIVTTVIFLVEENGNKVGEWSMVDMMLLLNKFNDCANRNNGKGDSENESVSK